jgi:hypothetical protein
MGAPQRYHLTMPGEQEEAEDIRRILVTVIDAIRRNNQLDDSNGNKAPIQLNDALRSMNYRPIQARTLAAFLQSAGLARTVERQGRRRVWWFTPEDIMETMTRETAEELWRIYEEEEHRKHQTRRRRDKLPAEYTQEDRPSAFPSEPVTVNDPTSDAEDTDGCQSPACRSHRDKTLRISLALLRQLAETGQLSSDDAEAVTDLAFRQVAEAR